jgi:hypothetical protein
MVLVGSKISIDTARIDSCERFNFKFGKRQSLIVKKAGSINYF